MLSRHALEHFAESLLFVGLFAVLSLEKHTLHVLVNFEEESTVVGACIAENDLLYFARFVFEG